MSNYQHGDVLFGSVPDHNRQSREPGMVAIEVETISYYRGGQIIYAGRDLIRDCPGRAIAETEVVRSLREVVVQQGELCTLRMAWLELQRRGADVQEAIAEAAKARAAWRQQVERVIGESHE
jgi:hypothetical protein